MKKEGPGHWVGSVPCIPFCASILLVGCNVVVIVSETDVGTYEQSRPNIAGLKCPSANLSVRASILTQKASSILMKFGM